MKQFISQWMNHDIIHIIKSGFINLSSITIIISILSLLVNFPVENVRSFLEMSLGKLYTDILPALMNGFYHYISLFTAVSIGYEAGKRWQLYVPNAMLMVLFIFLCTCPTESSDTISLSYLNSNAIFLAVLCGILVPFGLKKLETINLRIHMPKEVPDEVARSFEILLPDLGIILIVLSIIALVKLIFNQNIPDLIFNTIRQPMTALGGHLISLIIVNLGISCLWFFGFNGTYLFNTVLTPVLLSFSLENMQALAQGQAPVHIITGSFQSLYTHIGGSGSTLALIIAILLVSKNKHYQSIAKAALIPGIFNISEPIVYGLPVILNFKLFFPFLLCPVINTIITYFSMDWGLVNYTNGIQLPWTTPVLISGFLSSGVSGAVLQGFLVLINVLIYFPFINKNVS